MNELKYVIVLPKGFKKHQARAVIFNGMMVHSMVGRAAARSCGGRILSAGFLHHDLHKGWLCYGESESLGIKSDPEFDKEIIMNTLYKKSPYI